MGKRVRKPANVKKLISPKDGRLKSNIEKTKKESEEKKSDKVHHVQEYPTHMFFTYNTALGPPFRVLVDTNFINFSIQNKIDIMKGMMDCLYAKCTPILTDCVVGELEKLGPRFKVALRISKDKAFERIHCNCKGTYADDCLVQLVTQHRCFVVATCDKDLRRRLRKIPGVPIMYVKQRQFTVERLPDAYGAPR